MKEKITYIKFECDRCKAEEERNINVVAGTTLGFTRTHDMMYGNNTTGAYDLCQKCTLEFDSFMKESKHIFDLKHYYDTTVGMFATDRPDLVDDSMHRVLFELEEIKG